MKRNAMWVTLLALSLFSTAAEAQFGRLKKALDKARELSSLEITREDEIALGQAVSSRIRHDFGVVQDEQATRYVSLVGLVLAERSKAPDYPYQFIILDSDSVNAFAAPGGLIHITRGALASMENEAELAAVLGHEITHVTERHTVKEMQKMKGIELAEGQTNLRSNSSVLNKVADKVYEGMLKGFSRKEELDSDKLGARVAVANGYDPHGMVRFLEVLKALYRGESERAGLFASHPETAERIEKVEEQIRKKKLAEKGKISLADRFEQFIPYRLVDELVEELSTEGVRGMASGDDKDRDPKGEKDEKKKRQSRFTLAALKNPLDTREESESAEVSGAGGARGVDPRRGKETTGPKNPAVVEVKISKQDLERFKKEGQLT